MLTPPKHSRFRKGQSGNPSGRKKTPPELRVAFEAKSHKAADVLFQLLDKKHADDIRLKAAVAILDRHLGKPHQAVEVGTKAGTPLDALLTKLDIALDTLEPAQLLELAIGKWEGPPAKD